MVTNTDKGFDLFFRKLSHLFGIQFDKAKMETWQEVLAGYKPDKLILAIQDLAKTSTGGFAPAIGQVVERYKQLKNGHTTTATKEQILLSQKAAQGIKCHICQNKGFEDYERFVERMGRYYRYTAVCNCPHGADLTKVTKAQKAAWKCVTQVQDAIEKGLDIGFVRADIKKGAKLYGAAAEWERRLRQRGGG